MAHEYNENQMAELIDLMPDVMKALRSIKDVPRVPYSKDRLVHATRTIEEMQRVAGSVFSRLDDWCWHQPSCAVGETCENGKPGAAERKEAALQLEETRGDYLRDHDPENPR